MSKGNEIERRQQRNGSRENFVSPVVSLRDHDYIPKDNKANVISSSQTVINANEVKEYVSVSCQMDIDQQQMEDLTQNVAKLRTENKTLPNKLNDKTALRCKLSWTC